jgi:hypothetical protein
VTGTLEGAWFGWEKVEVILETPAKPVKPAVLIIHPSGNGSTASMRALAGLLVKKLGEIHECSPKADCYFIKCTKSDQLLFKGGKVIQSGNDLYVPDPSYLYGQDDFLYKTVQSMDYLIPKGYTHFFRTNLNVFLNLKVLNQYLETHACSMYTTFINEMWYLVGYSILYSSDVAQHIVSESKRISGTRDIKNRLHHAICPDDAGLCMLALGVQYGHSSKQHPFRCCRAPTPGVSQRMCESFKEHNRYTRYGMLLYLLFHLPKQRIKSFRVQKLL